MSGQLEHSQTNNVPTPVKMPSLLAYLKVGAAVGLVVYAVIHTANGGIAHDYEQQLKYGTSRPDVYDTYVYFGLSAIIGAAISSVGWMITKIVYLLARQ